MHSIIRAEKHKSIGSLKSRESHTFRKRETPNADPAKTKRNKLLFGREDYSEVANEKIGEYEKSNTVRKNAVVAIEYLLTASPEFFDAGPKPQRTDRLKLWCDAQVDFMMKQHGAENILCMYLHLDEKTPHIEVYVLPVDPKGKLNCRHFLNGPKKLSDLQTAYADHNKGFGLVRGMGSSHATHTEIRRFYEIVSNKAEITSEAVEEALTIDKPTVTDMLKMGHFLKDQQAKIVRNVIKLFKGTVYENKLLPQAKKILRDAKRRESETQKMKEKYEDQLENLKHQASQQLALIQSLEDLQTENKELRNAYGKILDENQKLKRQYGITDASSIATMNS